MTPILIPLEIKMYYILKLRMLKVACLLGHNVTGKKRRKSHIYRLLKHTARKCKVITHLFLRAMSPNFPQDR